MDNKDKEQHKKLSDRDHILTRPGMYVGAKEPTPLEGLLIKGDQLILGTRLVSLGLLKIINEILDNSTDEAIRTGFKHANRVEVSIDQSGRVSITDNGRGIPTHNLQGTDEPVVVACFTQARAGSNFDDENRKGAGMNGVGSFLTNVFSKEFQVITNTGETEFVLNCWDNCNPLNTSWTSKKKKGKGTAVSFLPDYDFFGLEGLDSTHIEDIYQRLVMLSMSYPKIAYSFNGEKIPALRFDHFVERYTGSTEIETIKSESVSISVLPVISEGSSHFFYINGLFLKDGGSIVDFVMKGVVDAIKLKLERRHPSITHRDIRSKIMIVGVVSNFNNCIFESQSKTKLSNTPADIKEFFAGAGLDLEKFYKRIANNRELIEVIEEHFKQKIAALEQIDLKRAGRAMTQKKIVLDKYKAPSKSCDFLVLTEGDSAMAPLIPVLGRETVGYFPLKGKMLNTWEAAPGDVLKNTEITNILTILGVDVSKSIDTSKLRFKSILLATDQDQDGLLIRGLFLAFAFKYLRPMLEQGKIKFLQTPICVYVKKGVPVKWFYDLDVFNHFEARDKTPEEKTALAGTNILYMKGLGGWTEKQLKRIIEVDGMEAMMQTIVINSDTERLIGVWHSSSDAKNQDIKKEIIRSLSFDVSTL